MGVWGNVASIASIPLALLLAIGAPVFITYVSKSRQGRTTERLSNQSLRTLAPGTMIDAMHFVGVDGQVFDINSANGGAGTPDKGGKGGDSFVFGDYGYARGAEGGGAPAGGSGGDGGRAFVFGHHGVADGGQGGKVYSPGQPVEAEDPEYEQSDMPPGHNRWIWGKGGTSGLGGPGLVIIEAYDSNQVMIEKTWFLGPTNSGDGTSAVKIIKMSRVPQAVSVVTGETLFTNQQ